MRERYFLCLHSFRLTIVTLRLAFFYKRLVLFDLAANIQLGAVIVEREQGVLEVSHVERGLSSHCRIQLFVCLLATLRLITLLGHLCSAIN